MEADTLMEVDSTNPTVGVTLDTVKASIQSLQRCKRSDTGFHNRITITGCGSQCTEYLYHHTCKKNLLKNIPVSFVDRHVSNK